MREKIYTLRGNISSAQKKIYECANILVCAKILILAAEIYSPNLCAAQKYFQAIFKSPQIFYLCAEIIMSHVRILGLEAILGMPLCRD